MSRIVILQGHPDASEQRYCRALAEAYAEAALAAGHQVQRLDVAALQLPALLSEQQWKQETLPEGVEQAQQALQWCEHLLLIYPLWLGDMPAALKAFLEQVLRPGFAFERNAQGEVSGPRLGGRSAHVVVTMGMPAFFYRWFYRAHSLKSLRRNILRFVGFKPVRCSVIGLVAGSASGREHWLQRMRDFGRRAR